MILFFGNEMIGHSIDTLDDLLDEVEQWDNLERGPGEHLQLTIIEVRRADNDMETEKGIHFLITKNEEYI